MADLAQFAKKDFDAVAWINTASAHRPPDEPLERYLAELEMKLQLTAEDVEVALQDYSMQALQRIPNTIHEIKRMKGEVSTLKGEVCRILCALSDSEGRAAASVAVLEQVDALRTKMEAAANTLQEATGLSSMLSSVEEVFSSGDIGAVSDTLAHMRRSLTLLGEVPGCQEGKKKLQEYEERLQSLVEAPLAAALAQQKGDKAQQLSGMLCAIGRHDVVEGLYLAARLGPLEAVWNDFSPTAAGGLLGWMPTFYDEVLRVVEHEAWWCSDVLSDLHPQLILALINNLLSNVHDSFVARLDAVIEEKAPAPLGAILQLLSATTRFASNLRQAMHGADKNDVDKILLGTYLPFEQLIPRYPALESAQLCAEISGVGVSAVEVDDVDNVVAVMDNSVGKAFNILEAALDRCILLTGGTSISAVLDVLDRSAVNYVNQLQDAIAALSGRAVSCVGSGAAGEDYDGTDELTALLPLLNIATAVVTKLSVFDALLRSRIVEVGDAVKSGSTLESDPLNIMTLRLHHQENLRKQLVVLSDQAGAQRFTALPHAIAAATTFETSVHTFLYDALMAKIKAHLKGIGGMREWRAAEEEGAVKLPTFSVYPATYVTAVGEYLMMLPQLLESLESEEYDEQQQSMQAEWLDKLAVGAAELYSDELERISILTPHGASQLAADLEYFCNVLSALSVDLPTKLATWQVALTFPEDHFAASARASLEGNALEEKVFDTVAKLRGIQYDTK